MDYLAYAWEIFKKHPLEWLLMGLVVPIIPFNFLLFPNVYRITSKSMASGVAPELGQLFDFDTLGDDAVGVFLVNAVISAAMACCVLPGLYAIPVLIWVTHLLADRRYGPVEALKASFAHGKDNFGLILGTMLSITVPLIFVALFTCGLGMVVALPVLWIAYQKFFEDHRAAIYAVGDAEGIPRRA
jgi:hypothetical protein